MGRVIYGEPRYLVHIGIILVVIFLLLLSAEPRRFGEILGLGWALRQETGYNGTRIVVQRVYLYVVRVRVLNHRGQPLSNALVTIYNGSTPIYSRHTDRDGYVETILPGGTYRVVVEHPAYDTVEKTVVVDSAKEVEVVMRSGGVVAVLPFDVVFGLVMGLIGGGVLYYMMREMGELAASIAFLAGLTAIFLVVRHVFPP